MDRLEYVNCILCGGNDIEPAIESSQATGLVKCRNDGLLYRNPRPEVSSVRAFHAHFVREDNAELFDGYRRKILQREAAAIKKIKPAGNLLDLGCASGTFFENFQGPNWHLYGVDSSLLGVETARARYKAEVFCGILREADYPTEFFDVVTILDTLYYVPDPLAELAEARRILKNDGLLAVELPGLTYSLLRERGALCWLLDRTWRRGFGPARLYYFSPFTTRLLLQRTGFRVIQMIPEQASLGRQGIPRLLNNLHFSFTRLLFTASGGRVSIAAKEFWLALKAECVRFPAQGGWGV
jgi:SAM-dependent methyltransferase